MATPAVFPVYKYLISRYVWDFFLSTDLGEERFLPWNDFSFFQALVFLYSSFSGWGKRAEAGVGRRKDIWEITGLMEEKGAYGVVLVMPGCYLYLFFSTAGIFCNFPRRGIQLFQTPPPTQ